MVKIFDKNKMELTNKKIYALDDYYYPITKKEMALVNVEYDLKNKTNYKNNENAGYAIIRVGNMIVHKEKLYIKARKK